MFHSCLVATSISVLFTQLLEYRISTLVGSEMRLEDNQDVYDLTDEKSIEVVFENHCVSGDFE